MDTRSFLGKTVNASADVVECVSAPKCVSCPDKTLCGVCSDQEEHDMKQTCDMCGVVWNEGMFEVGQSMNYHHINKKGDEKVMCDVCEDKWISPKNIKQCVKHGECGGHCSEEDWVRDYLEELEWSESKIEKFMEGMDLHE